MFSSVEIDVKWMLLTLMQAQSMLMMHNSQSVFLKQNSSSILRNGMEWNVENVRSLLRIQKSRESITRIHEGTQPHSQNFVTLRPWPVELLIHRLHYFHYYIFWYKRNNLLLSRSLTYLPTLCTHRFYTLVSKLWVTPKNPNLEGSPPYDSKNYN